MLTDVMQLLITHCIEIVFSIIGILLTIVIIPWLEDKKLYATILQLVEAAEKLAQKNDLNKLDYVIQGLELLGITVDDAIRTKIESCVLELDMKLQKTKDSNKKLLNE